MPPGLATAIHRALDKNANCRFPSVAAFQDALLPLRD